MDDVFISLFADDVKIATIIKSSTDAEKLQRAINKLKAWCDLNALHLNLDKCAVLTINKGHTNIKTDYKYGDHTFKSISEHKDLGVTIDSKLAFSKHIATITAKATAALGFIKRFCYDIADVQTLKSLYYALVQSHLEYCNVVWLPFYDVYINKIESVLKQFTMFARKEYPSAANNYRITSYKQRLEALKMTTLHRRRINTSVTFIYDILNGNANCPTVRDDITAGMSNRVLRRNEYIKIKDKNMKLALQSPVPHMCRQANLVPDLFTNSASRESFTTSLQKLPDSIFGL